MADPAPAAPLGYLADFAEPPPGTCFRLDPVHLRADTSGLVLFAAESAGIREDEGKALAEAIRPGLEEAGWALRTTAADRWYITHPDPVPVPVTRPLASVTGQPVSTCLPSGEGADEWLRRINELQMVLHGHPVNQLRASKAQPLINGLWLWGGGSLPAAGQVAYPVVQTTRCVLSGLAKLHQSLPVNHLNAFQSHSISGRSALIDLDYCEQAAASGDVQHWCEQLEQLEQDWFAPLLGALLRFRVHRLELIPLDGFRYPLRRSNLLAFWRGGRSWRKYLGK
jgi:hypothetical protein